MRITENGRVILKPSEVLKHPKVRAVLEIVRRLREAQKK